MKASQLKIDLRPGTKLSEHYTNRRHCYKLVETDYVMGYVVSSGDPECAAYVYPLYRVDIHMKVGKTWHIVSSYEPTSRANDSTTTPSTRTTRAARLPRSRRKRSTPSKSDAA